MLGHVQLPVLGADQAPATLLDSCGRNPGLACQMVWDVSHNGRAATLTSEFLAGPVHLLLRVLFVVLLALFVQALVHRLINRLTERAALSFLPHLRYGMTGAFGAPSRAAGWRLVQRGASRHRVRPRHSESDDSVADEAAAARAAAAAGTPADLAGAGTAASAAAATAIAAAHATANAATRAAAAASQPAIDGSAIDSPVVDGPVIDSPVVDGPVIDSPVVGGTAAQTEAAMVDERRKQRVRALGAILRSAASVTIFSIAGLAVLSDLGINLAPLLASAGVVGVAVGFGAQNLVRDYLSGIFMLVEDQYGVGDVITVGDATGTVENVTLRITRVRDVNGIVWHIRNGAIETVGNESQGWARAVIDFPVPFEADLVTIRNLLQGAGDEMWNEPVWRAVMLEAPEVWGAQEISTEEVTIRIVAKTAPLRQWEVEREMRARVKAALNQAGAFPAAEAGQAGRSRVKTARRPRPTRPKGKYN